MKTTLNKARILFLNHRKLYNSHKYSTELKNIAVFLLKEYPMKEVSKVLGVSMTSLKNWRRDQKQSSSSTRFVVLDHHEPEIIKTDPSSAAEKTTVDGLSLTLPYGLKLCMEEQSLEQISKLLKTLVKEFSK